MPNREPFLMEGTARKLSHLLMAVGKITLRKKLIIFPLLNTKTDFFNRESIVL